MSYITVIVTALLAAFIFMLVLSGVFEYRPKFTRGCGGAETGTPEEGPEYEVTDGGVAGNTMGVSGLKIIWMVHIFVALIYNLNYIWAYISHGFLICIIDYFQLNILKLISLLNTLI